MHRLRPSLVIRVVGFVVLILLLARRVDPAVVRASWQGMSASSVALALGGWHLAMVLRAWKWQFQARACGFTFRPAALWRDFLWGMLVGIVTPMRVGEVYRLAALDLAEPGSKQLAAAALIYEKAIEALGLALLVAIGAWWGFGDARLALPLTGAVFLAALVGLGPVPLPTFAGRIPFVGAALRNLVLARDALAPGPRAGFAALTLVTHALNIAAGAQVYLAFGHLDVARLFFGLPMVTFSAAVPITLSGFGLRELVAMQVFGSAGYPGAAAAVSATGSFLGANVLPALWVLPLQLGQRRAVAD